MYGQLVTELDRGCDTSPESGRYVLVRWHQETYAISDVASCNRMHTTGSFFQQMYANADEDTKRAMMKSYSESGGTTLSTNWEEVCRERVTVKPPQGQEWKQWN